MLTSERLKHLMLDFYMVSIAGQCLLYIICLHSHFHRELSEFFSSSESIDTGSAVQFIPENSSPYIWRTSSGFIIVNQDSLQFTVLYLSAVGRSSRVRLSWRSWYIYIPWPTPEHHETKLCSRLESRFVFIPEGPPGSTPIEVFMWLQFHHYGSRFTS